MKYLGNYRSDVIEEENSFIWTNVGINVKFSIYSVRDYVYHAMLLSIELPVEIVISSVEECLVAGL